MATLKSIQRKGTIDIEPVRINPMVSYYNGEIQVNLMTAFDSNSDVQVFNLGMDKEEALILISNLSQALHAAVRAEVKG